MLAGTEYSQFVNNPSKLDHIQYVDFNTTRKHAVYQDSVTDSSTCLCKKTTYESKSENCFIETENDKASEKDIEIYTDVAKKYNVLDAFDNNNRDIKRYINVAYINRLPQWFEWVCKCFSNNIIKNKVIGIIDNKYDSLFVQLLVENPDCCYLALRRGRIGAYIMYVEKCQYGYHHLYRSTFDIDFTLNENYVNDPFHCIEKIIKTINLKRSNETKLKRLIASVNPLVIRDII